MPIRIRKALISEIGDVSKISIVDADIADPSPNEVQVKVIYSGFSGTDINMRSGRYPMQRWIGTQHTAWSCTQQTCSLAKEYLYTA